MMSTELLLHFTTIAAQHIELPRQLFGFLPFYFADWSAFWAMGRYGFFVWLSFGLTYFLLVALIGWSYYQQRLLKHQIKAKLAREQRVKQYQELER